MSHPASSNAIEVYYQINRDYKADGYACGRVTMQGSVLDGAFAEADVIDEISLVVCPVVAGTEDKPLFMKSKISEYTLAEMKQYDGGIVRLNYKKNN